MIRDFTFSGLATVAIATFANVTPAMAVPVDTPALSGGLSPWAMFKGADWVVKTVMICLALASVATWTVLVRKVGELRRGVAAHRDALRRIDGAGTLEGALAGDAGAADTATALLAAATFERQQSADALHDAEGLKERVVSRLDRIEAGAVRRMQRGTSILATIGSVAPFVGLFGTVWGIMNSFVGIAETQTTNLAVVAPGIAEALLATSIGLVAAIPAVVIYNHFARQIAGYKALIGDISAAVLRLVSRDASRELMRGHHLRAAE